MFIVNDDLSIYATRGDIVCLNVSATDDRTGEPYEFQPGDILQMKIYVKKDAENVVLQKDFPVPAKTNTVGVFLTEQDTKIGDVISKPTDYWYEVTLNPYTNPQTFIGYDEDGAKIFKLFPEGKDITTDEPTKPEDIPVVDTDLSLLSSRPVENRAIARAITLVKNDMTLMDERLTGKIKANQKSGEAIAEELAVERARIDNLVASPTPGDSELVDIRVGADGVTYESAGTAVREQVSNVKNAVNRYVGEPVNLFNKDSTKNEHGYYIRGETTSSDVEGCGVSHPIYVEYGDSFILKYPYGTYGKNCANAFDKNGVFVKSFQNSEIDSNNNLAILNIDREAISYIVINVTTNQKSAVPIDKCMIVRGASFDEFPETYVPYAVDSSNMGGFVTPKNFSAEVQLAWNPLYGKVVSFNGDSICYGEGYRGGYGLMIANENNMIYENRGVSGGTITAETYFDDGKTRPKHWICRDIDNMRDDAEYIILEGGVNDSNAENIGAITEGFKATLNDSTFCGAFESMLKKAILKWPGKKIGYILSPKAYNHDGTGADKEKWDLARAICEKWSVPYLDLRNASGLNAGLPETRTMFFHNDDGVHPNESGYKVIVPKIVAWMKTL